MRSNTKHIALDRTRITLNLLRKSNIVAVQEVRANAFEPQQNNIAKSKIYN
jgi:hypothetical protein